ncbi:MAG: RluA family pseudouridine synthase [candidate division FCPU426 bacterium]
MSLKRWVVEPKDQGLRLDVFLARHAEGLSRSAALRALQAGVVTVAGRALKPGLVLRAGDEVTYQPAPVLADTTEPEPLPLEIRYQDGDLAVIDKPAGLVVHPAAGHRQGTLVNALLYHLRDLSGIGGVQRPGLVHRLDKETSGLLVVAKNDRTHQALAAALAERRIERQYEAVVWGHLAGETCVVDTLMGRDPRDRKRFAVVRSGGKPARTLVTVKRRWADFSLLRLKLDTGRTHQIRVHCRYLGVPVVGDRTYGRAGESRLLAKLRLERPARQLLHAVSLRFVHPRTGEKMSFASPWPDDFKKFVASLT